MRSLGLGLSALLNGTQFPLTSAFMLAGCSLTSSFIGHLNSLLFWIWNKETPFLTSLFLPLPVFCSFHTPQADLPNLPFPFLRLSSYPIWIRKPLPPCSLGIFILSSFWTCTQSRWNLSITKARFFLVWECADFGLSESHCAVNGQILIGKPKIIPNVEMT